MAGSHRPQLGMQPVQRGGGPVHRLGRDPVAGEPGLPVQLGKFLQRRPADRQHPLPDRPPVRWRSASGAGTGRLTGSCRRSQQSMMACSRSPRPGRPAPAARFGRPARPAVGRPNRSAAARPPAPGRRSGSRGPAGPPARSPAPPARPAATVRSLTAPPRDVQVGVQVQRVRAAPSVGLRLGGPGHAACRPRSAAERWWRPGGRARRARSRPGQRRPAPATRRPVPGSSPSSPPPRRPTPAAIAGPPSRQ